MDNLNLSDFFITKGQATDFSVKLSQLSDMIYRTDFHLESALIQLLGVEKRDKFLTLLRDAQIQADSPTALKEYIAKVQTAMAALPVITIMIAFEPKEQTLKLIADWFDLNLKKQVLFDFVIDTRLVAGLTLNFNGKFKDYSFKLPVEAMLEKLQTPQQQIEQHVQTSPSVVIPLPQTTQLAVSTGTP